MRAGPTGIDDRGSLWGIFILTGKEVGFLKKTLKFVQKIRCLKLLNLFQRQVKHRVDYGFSLESMVESGGTKVSEKNQLVTGLLGSNAYTSSSEAFVSEVSPLKYFNLIYVFFHFTLVFVSRRKTSFSVIKESFSSSVRWSPLQKKIKKFKDRKTRSSLQRTRSILLYNVP